jgi:alkyl hydroperoxide reductase subunit AhpF
MSNPIVPQPFQSGAALQDGSSLNDVLSFPTVSSQAQITAAGAAFAAAVQLTSMVNELSVVAAGAAGAKLPEMQPGQFTIVFNTDASDAAQIYSADSTIDGTAGTTGVALSSTKRAIYFQMSQTVILSAQLGVASA